MKRNLIYLLILLALGALAYFLTQQKTDQKITNDIFYDFAIDNIDEVHKIFIVNNVNMNSVLVEKLEDGKWVLENGDFVRKDRIETVLSTFQRAELLQMVPKSKMDVINSKMAANHKKIMIYGANDELIKTWYLSHATQNQQGTYALLEFPDKGKSSLPAVITLQGFRGYLGSRFGTDLMEWKSTEVWDFPDLGIDRIEVFRPKNVHDSFEIEIEDFINRKFVVKNNDGAIVNCNPEKLATYVAGYKSLYLESFRHNMTEMQVDSLKLLLPDYLISVWATNGSEKSVKLYHRPPTFDHEQAGYLLDPERLAGIVNDEVVSFQVYHMGTLLKTYQDLQ